MGLKLKKKIAIIGCGKIFFKHYEAIKLQKNKNKLELVAICDQNKKLLDNIKIKNLRKYNTINNLLNSEKLDIISILTPSGLHYNNAMECVGKVKTIIIEKPVTLKMSDAKKLLNYSFKKKTNIFVVLQNRFSEPIVELKKAVQKKLFGKIFLATVRLRWSRGKEYYSQAKWRGTWKHDGGVIANQSSHFIDLFQWIFGMPRKVFSKIKQMQKINKQVEDTALAIFEYNEKNKLGLIEATNAIRPKNLEGSLSIIGEKGTVIVGGMTGEKLVEWTIKKNSKVKNLLKINSKIKNGHIKFYEYVLETLTKKNKNSLDVNEAMKSLKIINSIYRSSNSKIMTHINSNKDTILGADNKKNL